MTETQKQNFIGGLVASIIAKKGIEIAVEKGMEAVARRHDNALDKSDVPVATAVVVEAVKKEVTSRVDHVTDNEPAYKSRNVWSTVVGVICAVDVIQKMWFDATPNDVMDYVTQVGLILSLLTPMYSRYIARKPLGE